jgi:hypothetical protein
MCRTEGEHRSRANHRPRTETTKPGAEMDTSCKLYEHKKGLNGVAISGIDAEKLPQDFVASGTANKSEGWAVGFNT